MRLTLLRHGLTEGNVRRLYYGSTDLSLLPEGLEALKSLRVRGGYPTASRYYTSGMERTEQTLEALYGPVPHGTLPGLREMDFGDFEMHTYEELREDPAYQRWISGDLEENACPGGESGRQVTARALEALATVLAAGEDAVCVTHGGVIGGLMMAWFPGRQNRYVWTPAPGTGFQVDFEGMSPAAFRPVPLVEER